MVYATVTGNYSGLKTCNDASQTGVAAVHMII